MSESTVSELVRDATSSRLVPALSTGLIAGIIAVIFQISAAAMIFSGGLSALAARGIGLMLAGVVLLTLITALGSSFRSAVAVSEDAPTAVLASAGVGIAATLGHKVSLNTEFMTVTAVLALSGILTGAVLILIGRLRMANLLRFMPYPVVGGFLAGTGLVFVAGALTVMSGVPVSILTLPRLAEPAMIALWLPGMLYGIVLFAITQRYSHFLILPGSMVAAAAFFYAALAWSGVSVAEARTAGFLISHVPAGGLWPAFTWHDLDSIDWIMVWEQFPTIFSVVLMTVVTMLLNLSGIELAAREELDMNGEFIAGGAANCVAGLAGCIPGCPAVSLSLLSLPTGVRSRWTGITAAVIPAAVVLLGGQFLGYVPKALLGGLLMLLGISFMHEWLVETRKRLPLPDYLIVIAIFLAIGALGFMRGIAFGLAAAVVFFVIRFSRVPVVKNEFTALDRHSIRVRPIPHRKILSREGGRIRCYELTGYIFFGSAVNLVESLKSALSAESHADFLLLDFAQVSGFDVSAISNFHRFVLNAETAATAVAVSAAPARLTEALQLSLPESALKGIRFFPDLDHGLEWCEDQLIEQTLCEHSDLEARQEALFHESVDDLMLHLERQERFEHLVECLDRWLEYRQHPAGSNILEKGEPADGLYLLTRGTAIESHPDHGTRLRDLTPGSVIAASAAFGDFTAAVTVKAESECETVFLSCATRLLLEQEKPELAFALHGFLIQSNGR